MAIQLFRQGVAPVIIVCGWRPLKRQDLGRYCESEVMEQYLLTKYGKETWAKDLVVLRESDSTSVPDNLVFVRYNFPSLRRVVIVVGNKVVPRIEFFAYKVFGNSVDVSVQGCDDKISDEATERRLLSDAICTLQNMVPGDISYLLLPPGEDGRLRSRWDELRIKHHDCPYWGKLHPGF
jgi:hypothetical protein